jgi:transposase
MLLQSDFVNKRPLLQATIEEAGHVCLFLPKFHCKLNPIELFWSYIKQTYCKEKSIAKRSTIMRRFLRGYDSLAL